MGTGVQQGCVKVVLPSSSCKRSGEPGKAVPGKSPFAPASSLERGLFLEI